MPVDGGAAADQGAAKLASILKALNDEIRRIMSKLDTEKGGAGLESDRAALATASRVREQVLRALEQRGAAVVDTLEAAAAKAARAVAKNVDLGVFDADMTKTLDDIVSGRTDDVTAVFKRGEQQIAAAMRLAITTGADLDRAIDDVAQAVDTTFLRAQAAVDAAAMGAGRAVTLRAGDDAEADGGEPMAYQYIGPDDGKTRPFCAGIMGRAFTRKAMRALDNGTDLPADIFGGGYNCRHSWAPLTMSEAKQQGITVED